MNFKNLPTKYYKQIGLYLWEANALRKFSETPKGHLETVGDTHMLRLIENHFKARVLFKPEDTIGVDLPEDIERVEAYFENRGYV